jgi:hypothetical protein
MNKLNTSALIQNQWLDTFSALISDRFESGVKVLTTAQYGEAQAVIADLRTLIGNGIVSDAEAARHETSIPGDFTRLMEHVESIVLGEGLYTDADAAMLNSLTEVISHYLSDKIADVRAQDCDEHTQQHVYQHADPLPIIHTKVTRNTKGYNYEASVTTVGTAEDNETLRKKVVDSLEKVYGGKVAGGEA